LARDSGSNLRLRTIPPNLSVYHVISE